MKKPGCAPTLPGRIFELCIVPHECGEHYINSANADFCWNADVQQYDRVYYETLLDWIPEVSVKESLQF